MSDEYRTKLRMELIDLEVNRLEKHHDFIVAQLQENLRRIWLAQSLRESADPQQTVEIDELIGFLKSEEDDLVGQGREIATQLEWGA